MISGRIQRCGLFEGFQLSRTPAHEHLAVASLCRRAGAGAPLAAVSGWPTRGAGWAIGRSWLCADFHHLHGGTAAAGPQRIGDVDFWFSIHRATAESVSAVCATTFVRTCSCGRDAPRFRSSSASRIWSSHPRRICSLFPPRNGSRGDLAQDSGLKFAISGRKASWRSADARHGIR